MFVTVVAVLCKLIVAQPTIAPDTDCTAEEARVEEIVTDSDLTDGLTKFLCETKSQENVAKWKGESPLYHSERWRIARVKCVPGHYEIRGRA